MSDYKLNMTVEQAEELPMVDLAFMVLKNVNSPMYYRELMNEIAKIKGISEEQAMDVIAQLYTEINIDGRFACVGNNMWGLKRWYPVDKSEDGIGGDRPRIINDDNDDDDDLDEELYEEEDTDGGDYDEDSDDEDEDELYDEEESEEVEEELDEEDLEDEELVDEDEESEDSLDEDGEEDEEDYGDDDEEDK